MRFTSYILTIAALAVLGPSNGFAAIYATFLGPTTGPVYEGDLVTIRLALASSSGDFLGGSGTLYSDYYGGETIPSPSITGMSISGTSNDGYTSVRYYQNGNADLVVNGSGGETYYGYLYSYHDFFGWHDVYGYSSRTVGFSAGSSFTVLNLAPVITSLTPSLSVLTGQYFGFGATAYDPGIYDVDTFRWDLDNDGLYNDYSGTAGSWSFGSAGLYTVGLQVSDGDGGFAYGSFNVNVADPITDPVGPDAVPEPSTLSMFALSVLGLLLSAARRVKTICRSAS